MSGSQDVGGLLVISMPGSATYQNYGLFAPSTIDTTTSNNGAPDYGIDLIAAGNLAIQQEAAMGLASIQNAGLYEFQGIGSLVSSWANDLQTNFMAAQTGFDNPIATALGTAIAKSAKACSGFFSCLF